MSRHVVVNGRELSMNDAGFIDPNSEWSVTVGEDGSVEVNRLDLKEENAKLRELACHMLTCIRYMESPAFDENGCSFCKYDGKRVCNFEERMKALDIEAEE